MFDKKTIVASSNFLNKLVSRKILQAEIKINELSTRRLEQSLANTQIKDDDKSTASLLNSYAATKLKYKMKC